MKLVLACHLSKLSNFMLNALSLSHSPFILDIRDVFFECRGPTVSIFATTNNIYKLQTQTRLAYLTVWEWRLREGCHGLCTMMSLCCALLLSAGDCKNLTALSYFANLNFCYRQRCRKRWVTWRVPGIHHDVHVSTTVTTPRCELLRYVACELKVVFVCPYTDCFFRLCCQVSAAVSASRDEYQLRVEKMVDVMLFWNINIPQLEKELPSFNARCAVESVYDTMQ